MKYQYQVIQHESGLYYTFVGKAPHVPLARASQFAQTGSAAQIVCDILNTAGRGRYTIVEVYKP